jgi:hypothetical protein
MNFAPPPTIKQTIEAQLGILQPAVIERLTAEADGFVAKGYKIDDLTIRMDPTHSWIEPIAVSAPAATTSAAIKEEVKPPAPAINAESFAAMLAGMSDIELVSVQVEARKLGDDDAVKAAAEELSRRRPMDAMLPVKRGRGRPPKNAPARAAAEST